MNIGDSEPATATLMMLMMLMTLMRRITPEDSRMTRKINDQGQTGAGLKNWIAVCLPMFHL